MKPTFYLPIIFLLTIPFVSCKKDPTKNVKLPPITQEGRNTVGFTINGEGWVPKTL